MKNQNNKKQLKRLNKNKQKSLKNLLNKSKLWKQNLQNQNNKIKHINQLPKKLKNLQLIGLHQSQNKILTINRRKTRRKSHDILLLTYKNHLLFIFFLNLFKPYWVKGLLIDLNWTEVFYFYCKKVENNPFLGSFFFVGVSSYLLKIVNYYFACGDAPLWPRDAPTNSLTVAKLLKLFEFLRRVSFLSTSFNVCWSLIF